jgi:hypothetical protein
MGHQSRSLASVVALAALCIFGAPTYVRAQSATYYDRNNNVSVLDRPRPDYEALGILIGSFDLYPSVTLAPEYNSNIFATTNDPIGDLITELTPTFEAKSNWSRNAIDIKATATANFYATHSSENTADYELSANGRLDILDQSNLSAGFTVGHFAIPRSAENTFGPTATPIQYDEADANLGAVQTLDRLRLIEGFHFTRTNYENNVDTDGAPLFLSQLDNDVFIFSGRASYAVTPAIAVFASASGNDRRYDILPPTAPLDRDSNGFETTVGTDFDITRLIRGQIQVGYLAQYYPSPAFHTVSGLAVHASVEYFPSGLTTITLHLDRNVVDAVSPTAVSFLQSQAGLQVDHELLRNVILSARGAYETDDYTGEQRLDERATASIRGTYLLNRHLGLTASYSFLNEYSSGAARVPSYRDNVVSISIVAQE